MSFDHSHYIPNVRWKAAERESLQWLGNHNKQEKARITPLIELIPPNFKTKDGDELPVRDALQRIAGEIGTHWGVTPAFVDLNHVLNAGICGKKSDPHVLEILAEEMRRGLPLFSEASTLIPVTQLTCSDDFQAAVASIIEEDKTGACLRVALAEVLDKGFATKLERLLSRLKLDVVDTDLIVDLQYLKGSGPNLQSLCKAIPQLSKWRSFTLLAGAFPADLQEIEKDTVEKLTRDEWFYWQEQVQLLSKGTRWPTFGDYTVQHAIYKEPNDNCNPSASIRYAFDDYWVILRGHGLKNKDSLGNAQYSAEAKLLCAMDEFCRPQFSQGDRYIYEASKNPNGQGNPRTWIRAGINHHMVFAARQIAAFVKTALRRTV